MLLREDFRRDGLAVTFLVDKDLFKIFISAFPNATRFNIGYPSICEEETKTCRQILELERDHHEFCLVGHAKLYDLDIMANLLAGHENVSANIWLPVSDQSANKILGCDSDTILKKAQDCIEYWKTISQHPLDIALTDVTASEPGIIERTQSWVSLLKGLGYRDIILCDTKGVGNKNFLTQLFTNLESFEWHAHNDNGFGLRSIELAVKHGASRIGTSVFSCGERMTMIDPRLLEQVNISSKILDDFLNEFNSRIGDLETLKNAIYGPSAIVTGIHHLLWQRNRGTEMMFGATSNKEIASTMLQRPVSSSELRFLKNKLLYQSRCPILHMKDLQVQAQMLITDLQGINIQKQLTQY